MTAETSPSSSPFNPGRVGIIGVGAIAEAIVIGLSALPEPPRIVLSPRNALLAHRLAGQYPGVEVAGSNHQVVDQCQLLLLCVRVGIASDVLDELDVPADRVLISAVAGWTLDQLAAHLPHGPRLVRAIPMPAVRTHEGLTALYPANPVAEALFEPLGGTLATPTEAAFDALSVTTSTVSTHLDYLGLVAAWLTEQGMPAEDADRFVRRTFAALGTSYADEDHSLAELRRHHETPGGLNESVRTGWFTNQNQAALRGVLNAVLAQITP